MCGHGLKDVTSRGPKRSTQLSVCHNLGHTLKITIGYVLTSFRLHKNHSCWLLIRCHHIYHGLHLQELRAICPIWSQKWKKGRVEHTFRFRKVRSGGAGELGERVRERERQGSAAAGGGDGGAGEARVPGQARRAGGAIRR